MLKGKTGGSNHLDTLGPEGYTSGDQREWEEFIFYFEQQIKRELQGIHICVCRCNERLKDKTVVSTSLGYTGLCGPHLEVTGLWDPLT